MPWLLASTCRATTATAEDTSAGWTAWIASWEQWPNDGKGGYVCTRSITWAYQDGSAGGYPSGACIQADTIPEYVDFGGRWSRPFGSVYYLDASCTVMAPGTTGYNLVYAPGGAGQASALCDEWLGIDYADNPWGLDVWSCEPAT